MSVTKVTDAMRNVTQVDAAKITTGTLPDARLPAVLPAKSGANLTALNASNIGSGTVPTARLGSGTASSSTFLRGDSTYAEAGGGKVLQCLSVTKTDTYTSGSSTLTNIPTLTLTITPATTSSKILMLASVSCDAGSAYWSYLGFARGGSAIGAGDASTNRIPVHAGAGNNASTYGLNTIAMNYLDSPSSTSAQTYTIQTRHGYSGGVTYINRTGRDDATSGTGYDGRYASTLTLFEIGA